VLSVEVCAIVTVHCVLSVEVCAIRRNVFRF
jgi:hypothetical protein